MKPLKELRKELDKRIVNPSFSDLKDHFDWFSHIEILDIESHFGFEEDSYCRILLIAEKEYDLLLCCWKPGQKSPLHGHPDQGCLVKILTGTLNEEVHFTDGRQVVRKNAESEVAYINDSIGLHSVWNDSTENAVSLHLYAPGGYKPSFQ